MIRGILTWSAVLLPLISLACAAGNYQGEQGFYRDLPVQKDRNVVDTCDWSNVLNLAAGARIRIQFKGNQASIKGRLVRVTEDSLVVRDSVIRDAYPTNEERRLTRTEILRIQHSDQIEDGILIGAGLGLICGVLIGLTLDSEPEPRHRSLIAFTIDFPLWPLTGFMGTIGGALVGVVGDTLVSDAVIYEAQ